MPVKLRLTSRTSTPTIPLHLDCHQWTSLRPLGAPAWQDSLRARKRVRRIFKQVFKNTAGKLFLTITLTDFFNVFGKRRPSFAPFTTPLYSSVAYSLLSWVVESASGQPFESFVKENIFDVVGMGSSSSGAVPEDGTGFVPAEDIWWDGDLDMLNP